MAQWNRRSLKHAIAFASLPPAGRGTDRSRSACRPAAPAGWSTDRQRARHVGIAAQTEARKGALGAQVPAAESQNVFLEQRAARI